MRARLSWLLLTIPPAATFGIVELVAFPLDRGGAMTSPLWLLGLQVLLWSGAAAGLGLALCLRRAPGRGAAPLAGLLAGTALWVAASVDPTARLPGLVMAAILAALLAAIVLVFRSVASRLPDVAGSPSLWGTATLLAAAVFLILPHGASSVELANQDPGAPAGGPNVLLISLDTCRIDCMGPYQEGCELTPRIDELARGGIVFENAAAPMPLTGPSHVGMLTGLAPVDSGVQRNGIALDAGTPSVAREFRRHGYRTAGFVSGLPMSDRSVGLGVHFDHYDDRLDDRSPVDLEYWRRPLPRFALRLIRKTGVTFEANRFERLGELTVNRALDWLHEEDERPFFLFCHLYDLHHPYEPPPRWQAGEPEYEGPLQGNWNDLSLATRHDATRDPLAMRHMRRLYEGEMKEVDHQVGRLLDGLAREGLDQNTIVVLTSDHGESLDEHDVYFDHYTLYDVEVRVPLILRLPGHAGAGTRVTGASEILDLGATLQELAGLPITLPGQSLVAAMEEGALSTVPRFATATVTGTGRGSWSVTRGPHKMILVSETWNNSERRDPQEMVFDLSSDPGETQNLVHERPDLRDLLLELLHPWWQRHQDLDRGTVESGLAEELSALGYGK